MIRRATLCYVAVHLILLLFPMALVRTTLLVILYVCTANRWSKPTYVLLVASVKERYEGASITGEYMCGALLGVFESCSTHIAKGLFILHRNCMVVLIHWLLSAASHCSITAFQVKMILTFMQHRNAVTLPFLCSRVQCSNATQLRRSLNGP